jgi:hypothetical protein
MPYYYLSYLYSQSHKNSPENRYYCREILCKHIQSVIKPNHEYKDEPIDKIQIRIQETGIVTITEAYINFLKTELGIESYEGKILILSVEMFSIQRLSLILLLLTHPYIPGRVCKLQEINFESFIKEAANCPNINSVDALSLFGFYLSKFKVKGKPILSLSLKRTKYSINGIATYTRDIVINPKKLISCQQALREFMEVTRMAFTSWFCLCLPNGSVIYLQSYLEALPEDLE